MIASGRRMLLSRCLRAFVAALTVLLAAPTFASEFLFVGVKKCTNCHRKEVYGDQISSWRIGPHAQAFESLDSPRASEIARSKNISAHPQDAPECLECHVTNHGLGTEEIKFPLDTADGIQCESCHGPGSGYRKKKIMSDHEEAVAFGLLDDPGKNCETCHNPRSPTWDPRRFALPDGQTTGFSYDEAVSRIAHPIPEENRGRVAEIEKEKRRSERKR